MKGIEYDRYGGPERMRHAEGEMVMPKLAELRVRAQAAAINSIDMPDADNSAGRSGQPKASERIR